MECDSGAQQNRDAMEQLTQTLLCTNSPNKRRHAATALHALLCSLSRFNIGSPSAPNTSAVKPACGTAISPADAGRCVLDDLRTSRYLQGICAAIRASRERNATGPIELLYAGCGPFATLALPVMTQFRSDEVRFTLVEVNAHALECARRAVRALGFDGHVRAYVQADASNYLHPPERPFDILIVEAMQRALEKEPQVAITLHLAAQLAPGRFIIPEEIVVDACLFDPATEFAQQVSGDAGASLAQRTRIDFGSLMILNAATAKQIAAGLIRQNAVLCLPAVPLSVPQTTNDRLQIMLRTTVRIFGSIRLEEYESGITSPRIAFGLTGERVTFQYLLGREPGFRWRGCQRSSSALVLRHPGVDALQ
jgi:hypothetical protein